mgnify:CR=1 FL=1
MNTTPTQTPPVLPVLVAVILSIIVIRRHPDAGTLR